MAQANNNVVWAFIWKGRILNLLIFVSEQSISFQDSLESNVIIYYLLNLGYGLIGVMYTCFEKKIREFFWLRKEFEKE